MVQPALAGIGIAITRPSNQAKKLTQLIENAGGHVISFPLIEIVPLDDYRQFEGVIADISSYEWVIFISSNAVQNGMPRLLKQTLPHHLKFAAIGPVTAKELQEFGVKDVLIPEHRFDSESLLSLAPMHDMLGKKVMIVRGMGGREVLADTLKSRGADVTFAECYQRINPQKNIDILTDAWSKQQLQAIVVTSSEAMRHLLELAVNAPWLKQVTICVNHARIAEQTLDLGFEILIADAPGDEAMFNTLLTIH
ncbi:MAG: uroporphyrinogen III synthase [Methylophilaceae bacterium 17-44-8]|nr:MAG: uroporphyrinogen III synthase [Methylophilaceae bacterium 17-44-8]